MKREIKFRGISVDTGKMIIGYGVIHSKWGSQVIHEQGINIAQHTEVIPETVSEFTGLKDKNRVDIYEGDILQLDDVLVPVTFDDGGFQIVTNTQHGKSPLVAERTKRFVVIGNIYSNPKILTPLTNLK